MTSITGNKTPDKEPKRVTIVEPSDRYTNMAYEFSDYALQTLAEDDRTTTTNIAEIQKTPPTSKASLFTNFEDVQLTDEERLFLSAAALGDLPIVRQSLEESEDVLNVNCVDYMGRNALHLAIDSDCLEAIDILLDRLSFECMEEALLHAISKGGTKTVKLIIEHPNYMAGEERNKRVGTRDPYFRTEEKSQFSPDITPLILAAHYNNHEIIQMFLSRNHRIEKPHPIACQCNDCVTKQNYDSLKRSRSRLNAYRALASPAYMALSNPDPIMSTFELRQEMKKLAQVEKEFKSEYLNLVEECMNFACELMDLCRGTQEVEAVLSSEENGTRDPLARLKMAMEYEEKKFVSHPNCQQHLTNIWFGPEMGFMQSMPLWKKLLLWLLIVPLVPFVCIVYIFSPESKLGNALRCPVSKFITHTLSHICFLILLSAATFRLDERTYPIRSINITDLMDHRYNNDFSHNERIESLLKGHLRAANTLMTNVQICLMFWIFGLLWMECKQIYTSGVRVYLLDVNNWIDWTVLSLYLASYLLRFLVDHWIKKADVAYNGTMRAYEALHNENYSLFINIFNEIKTDHKRASMSYFMYASRFEWEPDDPEIVSDVLFAVANVLSIARTTYLMPAFEVLGPLQISLGRMLGDITRFLVLFTLVLFAFMVGLHNLYWYYGAQTYDVPMKDGSRKLVHTSEAFQGLPRTLYSLFWSMFGLVSVDSVEIKYPNKRDDSEYLSTFPTFSAHATSVVEGVGMILFGAYQVAIVIVLVNMLIAMMSHSFEDIQTDCDVEWKFARTRLWMNYIDEGSTLPVPFNMIPTPKSLRYAMRWFKDLCVRHSSASALFEKGKRQTFIKDPSYQTTPAICIDSDNYSLFGATSDGNDEIREEEPSVLHNLLQMFFSKRREKVCQSLNIEAPETSYADILQRLVRRYLFKLERLREESGNSVFMLAWQHVWLKGMEKPASTSGVETVYGGSPDTTKPAEPFFADSEETEEATPSGDHLAPPPAGPIAKRRMSMKPGAPPACLPRGGRRRPSLASMPNPSGVQLLSLPQLDAIQRSLKLLDVRVQHVQSTAKDDEKMKDNVEHIRKVMSENQKALGSVITVLASIQEEVRAISIAVHKPPTTLHIQPPSRKKSNHSSHSNEHSSQETSQV